MDNRKLSIVNYSMTQLSEVKMGVKNASLAETCVSMNQNHQNPFALSRDVVSDIMAVGFSL
jgi:hypothetical protein